MTFPEFQRAGSNSCWSGKGEDEETREEQSRNSSAALGHYSRGSPSRGTHNNIFELFYRTKPPTNEGVNYLMKHSSFQREGHSLITMRTREGHQTTWSQIKGMQALHTPWSLSQLHPWTMAIKPLTKSPQVGTHSFWGTSPPCPHLPDKTMKLFFSTSPKTLSPRFSSAPVCRGRIFSIKNEMVSSYFSDLPTSPLLDLPFFIPSHIYVRSNSCHMYPVTIILISGPILLTESGWIQTKIHKVLSS